MGFGARRLVVLAASLNAACTATPATTSPDCRVFATNVSGTSVGGDEAWTLLYVLDPALRTLLPASRSARVEEALVTNVQVLLTGDRELDGTRDFNSPRRLRAIVLDAAGTPATASLGSPSLGAGDGPAEIGDAIEVWPGHDPAWDAWFVEATRSRVNEALGRDVPASLSLVETARAFLEAHPEHASEGPFVSANVLVVLVTPRDDTSPVTGWGALRYRTVLGLVAAIPVDLLPPPGAPLAFDRLLDTQSFDEGAVGCADGAVVGVYPRELLALGRAWQSGGGEMDLVSLCAADERLPFDGTRTVWGSESRTVACLPRPLPRRIDGTVGCVATVLLPAAGPARRCADVRLDLVAREVTADGPRERCALPQVSPVEGLRSTPGFYYDDLGIDLFDTCGDAAQRLLVWNVALPPGSRLDARCAAGTDACGLTTEQPDAGADGAP
jgi:hypothetical protein